MGQRIERIEQKPPMAPQIPYPLHPLHPLTILTPRSRCGIMVLARRGDPPGCRCDHLAEGRTALVRCEWDEEKNQVNRTDWARVDTLTDETIDTSDIPPLTDAFFARARLRQPRQPVAVTLHVDPDVLVWFKALGDSYEQRINAALRIYAEAHQAYRVSAPMA